MHLPSIILRANTRVAIAALAACAGAVMFVFSVAESQASGRSLSSAYSSWHSGGGTGNLIGGGGSVGDEGEIPPSDEGNDDGEDISYPDDPPWPGDDDEDEDDPGSGVGGGSGGGGGGSGSPPPGGGGENPSSYNGFLWGGASEVFLNGIGTPDTSWKSELVRAGDTAGALAPSPDRTVVPATGRSLEEIEELSVELPGRNFVLTRNFTGKSELMRRGSFGPLTIGGWTLSVDATVFPDLIEPTLPMKSQTNDTWKRMGIAILMQSPLRTTIGFHNFLQYKPEAVWYYNEYDTESDVLQPPTGTLQPELFREFRPMGPGLCRLIADKLTYRHPFRSGHTLGNGSEVTLPVWKLVEPGKGTSYFFRACETGTSGCFNMAKQSGGFDTGAGYNETLVAKVPAGKLWCQFDEFGNAWSYEYIDKAVSSGTTPRLGGIYLHGLDRQSCRAHVRFEWGLGKDLDDTLAGSGLWHIKRIIVDRPFVRSGSEDTEWLCTDVVDYNYQADVVVQMGESAPSPVWLSSVPDDLLMVVKRTAVNLPMSLEPREGPTSPEHVWNNQVTLYRYTVGETAPIESQLKAVFSPTQLDVMTRQNWKTDGGSGDSLWELGDEVLPDLISPVEAAAWGLMTLTDTDLIAPTEGSSTGPALKVWQTADRWSTYYGFPRTEPADTGSSSWSGDFGQFKGRLMTEFSKPGRGGPTLRRDSEYATDQENLTDVSKVKRTSVLWPDGAATASSFNHSYLLRSSVQRVTESTRRTDSAVPTSTTLWQKSAWSDRRRTTNRSEERELLSFAFEQRYGAGTPSIHVQSLVSAVPFTVAELIEDLTPGTSSGGDGGSSAPIVKRKWLTCHLFDDFNRPLRTIDPGAFIDEYPDSDPGCSGYFLECRLKEWRDWIGDHTRLENLGSFKTTIYQDHDPDEPSDPAGPSGSFMTLLGGSTWPGTASKSFLHNYPSTLRLRKQFVGWYPTDPADVSDNWRLQRVERYAGELRYHGNYDASYYDDIYLRPDLLLAEYQCRDGDDVDVYYIDVGDTRARFEAAHYNYVTTSSALIGCSVLKSIDTVRERETTSENGTGGTTTGVVYFDTRGRVAAREFPSGVKAAYVYPSGASGEDPTGCAIEVHEDVTLTLSGGYVTGFTPSETTLSVSASFDVSGNKLSDTTADGVRTSRQYVVIPDSEASPPVPTVRVSHLPVIFGEDSYSGPISCQWLNSSGQPYRNVSFKTDAVEVDEETGAPINWDGGQELSRSETDYLLSGLASGGRSWAFASTGGVLPSAVPDQDGARSIPYETTQVFDGDGNAVESVDALGNVVRSVYDARSRLIEVHKTVLGESEDWLTEERFYDNETSSRTAWGNGLLTRVAQYVDDEADEEQARQVKNWYDPRDRLILTAPVTVWEVPEVPAGPLSLSIYDNLDRVTLTAQLHPAEVSNDWSDATEADVLTALATGISRTSFSQRGLVYRTEKLIDDAPAWLRTDHWFDDMGRELAVRTPGSPMTRRTFDSHGRVITEASFAAEAPTSWSDATSMSDGFMLTRTHHTYHDGKAVLGLTAASQRTHTTVPSSGSIPSDSFVEADTGKCVTTYVGPVYDKAARVIGTANYGTNNGAAGGFTSIVSSGDLEPDIITFGQSDDPATTISGLSGTVLVSRTRYNAQGLVDITSRIKDLSTGAREDTKTFYDSLGRVIAVSENDKGSLTESAPLAWSTSGGGRWTFTRTGTWPSDESRVTTKVYDAAGNVTRHVAHSRESTGSDKLQITGYRYTWNATADGGSTDTPTPTPRHGLLYEINYPATSGSAIGDPSSAASDTVRFGYNLMGEQAATKDQNGTVRSFIRDRAGRMIADRVMVFGSTAMSGSGADPNQHYTTSVDSTVSQIITRYDGYGRTEAIISCLNPGAPYDPEANLEPATLTSTLLGDSLVQNFVAYVYKDPLGEIVTVRQSAEGSLPSGTDTRYREVRHNYSIQTDDGSLPFYRLSSTVYPDATPIDPDDDTEVHFDYSTPIEDAISRPRGMILDDETVPFVKYAKLGLSTTAVTDFPQIGVQLDRTVDASGNRDYDAAGGPVSHQLYGGWDQFGRLIRNSWVKSEFTSGGPKPVWQEFYQYDLLTRKTKRDNTRGVYAYKDEDWKFTYDGLSRAIKSERGEYSSGGSLTIPTTGFPIREWTLDALGNWKQQTLGRPGVSSIELRDHNAANEIKYIGSVYRFYDAGGNLVRLATDSAGASGLRQSLVFDAWNRLVSISKLKTVSPEVWDAISYAYNGLNWCVRETRNPGDSTTDDWRWRFYSTKWQLLLEARGTSASGSLPTTYTPAGYEQQFWGLRGTDDAIRRRIEVDGDPEVHVSGDKDYYQLTDALFSVIAHVNANDGRVRQWISYDAYGTPKILRTGDWDGNGATTTSDLTSFNTAFAADDSAADVNGDGVLVEVGADSDVDAFGTMHSESAAPADEVRIGFAGYVTDPLTKHLLARNRWYEPAAGRWLTRDPAGYVEGMSLYVYVKGNPLGLTDPTGLYGWGDYWHDATSLFMQPTQDTQTIGRAFGDGARTGAVDIARAGKGVAVEAANVGADFVDTCAAIARSDVDALAAPARSSLVESQCTGSFGENARRNLTAAATAPIVAPVVATVEFVKAAENSYRTGEPMGSQTVDFVTTVPTAIYGAVKAFQALKGAFAQPSGIVYRRTDPGTGEQYVGQSKSEALYQKRQQAHDRKLGVPHDYEVVGRAEPGRALNVLEEDHIRLNGGPKSQGGSLANKRYQMNEGAYRSAGGRVDKPTRPR